MFAYFHAGFYSFLIVAGGLGFWGLMELGQRLNNDEGLKWWEVGRGVVSFVIFVVSAWILIHIFFFDGYVVRYQFTDHGHEYVAFLKEGDEFVFQENGNYPCLMPAEGHGTRRIACIKIQGRVARMHFSRAVLKFDYNRRQLVFVYKLNGKIRVYARGLSHNMAWGYYFFGWIWKRPTLGAPRYVPETFD